MRRIVLITAVLVCVVACGPRSGQTWGGDVKQASKPSRTEKEKTVQTSRHFQADVKVPAVYSDKIDAYRYVGEHYWDEFFDGTGKTDSLSILGVPNAEVEQAMANFVKTLEFGVRSSTPDDKSLLEDAQGMVENLFRKIEKAQKDDPASFVYLRMTEMVEKYLYDPNSPMRNEDLYLPFVKAMASSDCTADDMRKAYSNEVKSCSVNRFGEKAPDFRYRTQSKGSGSLYGIKADWTILFFSNPGCNACKTIVNDLKSIDGIEELIFKKKVAVLNIYIDEEIDKWREYLHNYPPNWICGYDYLFKLRDGDEYKVRAIPSLYLLDDQKRVVLKDAPTERLVEYIENKVKQTI